MAEQGAMLVDRDTGEVLAPLAAMADMDGREFEKRLLSLYGTTPREYVSQRDGGKAGKLDYVEWAVAAQMLASVFPDYEGTIVALTDSERGWLCHYRIRIGGAVRENVGYAPLKQGDLDCGAKDAVSDAFKRTAAMFGVCLDLWGKTATKRMAREMDEDFGHEESTESAPNKSANTPAYPKPSAAQPAKATASTPSATAATSPPAASDGDAAVKSTMKAAFAKWKELSPAMARSGVTDEVFWAWVKRHFEVESRADMTAENWSDLCDKLRSASRNDRHLKAFAEFVAGRAPTAEPLTAENVLDVPAVLPDSTELLDEEQLAAMLAMDAEKAVAALWAAHVRNMERFPSYVNMLHRRIKVSSNGKYDDFERVIADIKDIKVKQQVFACCMVEGPVWESREDVRESVATYAALDWLPF